MSMVVRLIRAFSDDEGTAGVVVLPGGETIRMMELPWRDNARSISCIPPGRYQVNYLPRSASGKYRDVYHLQDVPDRTGILIHAGNWAGNKVAGYRTHSWGCLLPALKIGRLSGQRAGLASRAALRKLHAATGRQSFILEVI
ncbi:MAG: DUF5675 family protein [Gammaproteobacteria bacterium]|nr:DUF5675 family protein [Gammaproteobacteria bacterium]